MQTVERVMRALRHVNISAALGMVAWLVWSGHLVVSEAWRVPRFEPAAPAHAAKPAAHPSCCFVLQELRGTPSIQVDAERAPRLIPLDGAP